MWHILAVSSPAYLRQYWLWLETIFSQCVHVLNKWHSGGYSSQGSNDALLPELMEINFPTFCIFFIQAIGWEEIYNVGDAHNSSLEIIWLSNCGASTNRPSNGCLGSHLSCKDPLKTPNNYWDCINVRIRSFMVLSCRQGIFDIILEPNSFGFICNKCIIIWHSWREPLLECKCGNSTPPSVLLWMNAMTRFTW